MSSEYEEFMNSQTKKTKKVKSGIKVFEKASYSKLNSKQKENYNFHRLASLLASFGFNCIWLNDDVHGADLLALSTEGDVFKIQLKGRLTFDKKYLNKNLYMAFPNRDGFYIYPHDLALQGFIKRFEKTKSWNDKGQYSMKIVTNADSKHISDYFVNEDSVSISF